uniref:Replicative DNA helicase n=1 Tax=Hommersandiophycus borowitzkae TaxID=268573 RepID=A0A1G4NUD4_9FLOR|nr:Replication helicase subunit [Hommersandiophycus borowitzkae]SCW22245.1 Replication helicase subunit [Hommersandiophycus borowitzkae]
MLNHDSPGKYHTQLPPQHNLAEEIILGGVLISTDIADLAINELITESFSLEAHQIIYRTIVEIYIQKTYVDSIILINTLWELNLLSIVGGIRKILNLLKHAQVFISQDTTYLTAQYYIHILKDKHVRRLLIQYGYNIIKLSYIPSITPHNIFAKTEKYIEEIKLKYTEKDTKDISNHLSELLINLKTNHPINNNDKLRYGFHGLDKISNGLAEGDLIVIAGRPSMGKTSLSLNIVLNLIAQTCNNICIFSLEMSREQILYKLLSIHTKIPVHKLHLGNLSHGDWIHIQQTANLLVHSKIYINDTANLSISDIITITKAIKDEYSQLKIIIIDYLQLIQSEAQTFSNRAEELSVITRSLKILAKELNITIIILSQLNRNVENRINKQPLLSDLKESGCLHSQNTIKQLHNILYDSTILYEEYFNQYRKLLLTYQTYNIQPKITKTYKQYNYQCTSIKYLNSNLTHNHQILSAQKWQKIDNLKYKNKVILKYKHYHRLYNSLQNILFQYTKTNMYDIITDETKAFICNKNYILHNSIEQDADLVLMLYRESYYLENNNKSNKQNITNLIIAKHRNGPTGNIELHFNPILCSFNNP